MGVFTYGVVANGLFLLRSLLLTSVISSLLFMLNGLSLHNAVLVVVSTVV